MVFLLISKWNRNSRFWFKIPIFTTPFKNKQTCVFLVFTLVVLKTSIWMINFLVQSYIFNCAVVLWNILGTFFGVSFHSIITTNGYGLIVRWFNSTNLLLFKSLQNCYFPNASVFETIKQVTAMLSSIFVLCCFKFFCSLVRVISIFVPSPPF